MYSIIPFKPEHLLSLLEEPLNKSLHDWFIRDGNMKGLEDANTVSIVNYGGEVMVCGGIMDYWTGRGQLWAVFSETSKRRSVPTFRAIKRWVLEQMKTNYRRIEVSVDCDFKVGKRRVEMLGFSLECERARKYLPNGRDVSIYCLVGE